MRLIHARSFHGGEAGDFDNEPKALLNLFKQVPKELCSSRQELGQQVAATRNYFLKRYYRKDQPS